MTFKTGDIANPKGRPVGSKNKNFVHSRAFIKKVINEEMARDLLGLIYDSAMGGDMKAADIIVERLYAPPIKHEVLPDEFRLEGETVLEQARSVIDQVVKGALTPGEADGVIRQLGIIAKIESGQMEAMVNEMWEAYKDSKK